jgi:hypothetical protein
MQPNQATWRMLGVKLRDLMPVSAEATDELIGKFCVAGCGGAPVPATVASVATAPPTQSPTYLKCAMKGDLIDSQVVYSFLLNANGQPATWVEYGIPLHLVVHSDDGRILTRAKFRVPGWPPHENVSFNLHRPTLTLDAYLYRPSPPTGGLPVTVGSLHGTCKVVASSGDIVTVTPPAKPIPKATASLKRCDGVEALVVNERRCLKPKDTFNDCPECPEMVVVPAGEFMMGSPGNEANRDNDEGPQRKVTIAKPFAVGKFEVTFAEWDACVAAGGCSLSPDDEGWGHERQPVINVSWDDATKEYLPWLSRKTGKTYRLLTETEWDAWCDERDRCVHDLSLGQRHRQEPRELHRLRQQVG